MTLWGTALSARFLSEEDEMTNTATTKRCPSCRQTLPLTAFPKDSSRPRGVRSHCSTCYAKRRAAHYWTPERLAKRVERDRRMLERLEATAAFLATVRRDTFSAPPGFPAVQR